MISGKQIKDSSISISKLLANGNFSLDGNRLTDIGLPVNDSDGASKLYVVSTKESLSIKEPVKVATTTSTELQNIDNSLFIYNGEVSGEGTDYWSNIVNPKNIDGISITDGDRILIKNAINKKGNGIWVYNDIASRFYRATDTSNLESQPGFNEVRLGIFCFVMRGSSNINTGWLLVSNGSYPTDSTGYYNLGTDELTFEQFTGASNIIAGAGLSKSINTFNINYDDTTIGIDSDTIYVKNDGIATINLQNNAVTNQKLAPNSVESDNIVNGTIIGDDIANNTITSNKLDTYLLADIINNTNARHVHTNKYIIDLFSEIGSPGKLLYNGKNIAFETLQQRKSIINNTTKRLLIGNINEVRTLFIDYVIERNSMFQSGSIQILHDGVNIGYQNDYVTIPNTSDLGITFAVNISLIDIALDITLDNIGYDSIFDYTLRQINI